MNESFFVNTVYQSINLIDSILSIFVSGIVVYLFIFKVFACSFMPSSTSFPVCIDLGSLKEIFCAERDEIMKNGIVIGDE